MVMRRVAGLYGCQSSCLPENKDKSRDISIPGMVCTWQSVVGESDVCCDPRLPGDGSEGTTSVVGIEQDGGWAPAIELGGRGGGTGAFLLSDMRGK